MAKPTLFGPSYSTYARTARLTLEEKGVPHDFVVVDFLQGMPADQVKRHPFGKVPAFEHDGFELYETGAIVRYIDEAFDGPALQPADAKLRARMTQIIGIVDSYAYESMIQKILIPRVVAPMMGGTPDEEAINAGLPTAKKCLQVLEKFVGDREYLVGDELTLADLYCVPVLTYFKLASDSQPLLQETPGLRKWYDAMRTRASVETYCPEGVK